jgi:NADH:ubiquinone reductase (H+-translocating)
VLSGELQTVGTGSAQRSRVVIIGGGFGGMFAARRLRHTRVDVVLLDRETSHLFQPLLYQCATGLLSEGQISTPLRTMQHRQRNTKVLLGAATGVDPASRTVTAARADGTTFSLPYDYLIVAVGMRQSYFGHEEFASFAPGMKTLEDALTIRRRIYSAFEMAETIANPEERAGWLTFAITGAGPTGVELAGQIRDLATLTIAREFRTIDPREARVLLFDGQDAPLSSFGRKLSSRAARQLIKLGVELHMGTRVVDVDGGGLTATDGDGIAVRYPARTVIWTAGVEAVAFVRTLAEALDVEQDRTGRIAVNPDLTAPGHDNVWIIGDIMERDGLPGVAEVAMQGGMHAAGEIHRRIQGQFREPEVFRYRDLGSAAYISRFHALVKVGPLKLSGLVGWVFWAVIHLSFLVGIRNRLSAVTTWLFALSRGRRMERAFPQRDL